jgi:hypothetical protein
MSKAILFSRCLGFNDARAFATFKMVTDPRSPEAGYTELVDCQNLTTTPDGCLEKRPDVVTELATGAAVTRLSGGKRFLFQDATTTKEWRGGTTVNSLTANTGPMAQTAIDARISAASVYKSTAAGAAAAVAAVGTYAGPPVSKPFYAMPTYEHAFIYNAKLYAINGTFLQYSEDYAYDLWALGDNFIPSQFAILQGGAVPGALITTHAEGVTVYSGTNPADFVKKFYPCEVLPGTLFSGFVSKVYSNTHVWLCADGVYVTDPNGAVINLTVDQTDYLDTLNTTYSAVTVQNGKYYAFGDAVTLEYDFKTKTLLKHSGLTVADSCIYDNKSYLAIGSNIVSIGTAMSESSAYTCSLTLPYSDLSTTGKKSISSLYFTGTIVGDWEITATDQEGNSWTLERSDDLEQVTDYRIKTPLKKLGNHISLSITCTTGKFRLERLTAELSTSKRTR